MTLREFSENILKPSLIQSIKAGAVDSTFGDPRCLMILIKDPDLRKALLERLTDIENACT